MKNILITTIAAVLVVGLLRLTTPHKNFHDFFLAASVLLFVVYLIYRVYIALSTGVVKVPLRGPMRDGLAEQLDLRVDKNGVLLVYRERNPTFFLNAILVHCCVAMGCFLLFLMSL